MFKTAGLEERKECVKGDEKVKKSFKFSKKRSEGKLKSEVNPLIILNSKKEWELKSSKLEKKEKIVIATRQYYERNLI